jgi:hypothetical protein
MSARGLDACLDGPLRGVDPVLLTRGGEQPLFAKKTNQGGRIADSRYVANH